MPTVEQTTALVIVVLVLLVPLVLAIGYTVNWTGQYIQLIGGSVTVHVPLP